jgi:hypothetical protein
MDAWITIEGSDGGDDVGCAVVVPLVEFSQPPSTSKVRQEVEPFRRVKLRRQMFRNSEVIDVLEFVPASEFAWNHITLWPKRYLKAVPNTRCLSRVLHDLDVGVRMGSGVATDADKEEPGGRSIFEGHGNTVGYEQPCGWQHRCKAAMADMSFESQVS